MKLYHPKQPFAAEYDGVPVSFNRETLVEEGHPVLDAWPELFEEIEAHFKAPKHEKRSVEKATKAPGEKR